MSDKKDAKQLDSNDNPVADNSVVNALQTAEKNPKAVEEALKLLSEANPFSWTTRLGNVGQAIEEWRKELIEDLGGDDQVSAMERVVVDLAAKAQVMLDMIDQYIMDPYDQKIIDLDRKQVTMIVLQRRVLSDSLERYMKDLGLRKRKKQKHVREVIAELMEVSEGVSTALDEKAIKELRLEEERKQARELLTSVSDEDDPEDPNSSGNLQ